MVYVHVIPDTWLPIAKLGWTILQVPRVFYVNAREPAVDGSWHKIVRLLPRGTPCLNLYEIVMTEMDFLDRSKVRPGAVPAGDVTICVGISLMVQLKKERNGACRATPQDLLAFFNGVQVDGVYETHVPLLFRAVIELGNVCAVRQRTQNIDTEFELAELRSVVETADAYLKTGSLRCAGAQSRPARVPASKPNEHCRSAGRCFGCRLPGTSSCPTRRRTSGWSLPSSSLSASAPR